MSEIAIVPQSQFLPAMTIGEAIQRRERMVEFVQKVMKADTDFGVIPGTKKPTLLKPGAEKLCTLFGLTIAFDLLKAVEDWTGAEHGNEAFFFYQYRCRALRNGMLIAEADGSCNSWEKKYRYRDAQRKCPHCGRETIIKGKAEYGGGWLCFAKKGGCGAKFEDGDPAIEGQQTGQMFNPDVYDTVNTIQKMSQKRALVAVTLIACNASEFFTQDMEDFADRRAAVDADAAYTVDPDTGEVMETQNPGSDAANGETLAGQMNTGKGPCSSCNAPAGKVHGTHCKARAA